MKSTFLICVMLFVSSVLAMAEKDCGYYLYKDPEDSEHLIELCIDGKNVSGDVTKYIGGIGSGDEKFEAKFTGKVISGLGTDNLKLEITFQGDNHNLDCDKKKKAVWKLKPHNELKVPVNLPIGRTGYREIETFFAQDFN
jgi:hypothetical protein